uniref:Uncharacterized protein n=1 Tax=Sphaerodactylus townsendi TaxID=933632 RepID=A0ACB8F616_9SAUR
MPVMLHSYAPSSRCPLGCTATARSQAFSVVGPGLSSGQSEWVRGSSLATFRKECKAIELQKAIGDGSLFPALWAEFATYSVWECLRILIMHLLKIHKYLLLNYLRYF